MILRATYLSWVEAWPAHAQLTGASPQNTCTRRYHSASASLRLQWKSWFCHRWGPPKRLHRSLQDLSVDRSSSLGSDTTSSRFLCWQGVTGESVKDDWPSEFRLNWRYQTNKQGFCFLGFIDMHVFTDEGPAWSEEKWDKYLYLSLYWHSTVTLLPSSPLTWLCTTDKPAGTELKLRSLLFF